MNDFVSKLIRHKVTANLKQGAFLVNLPAQNKAGNVRENKLLDVVDELLSHHDDEELLGQFDEAAAGAALRTHMNTDVKLSGRLWFPAFLLRMNNNDNNNKNNI